MKEIAADINAFVTKLIKARHNFRLRDNASYEGAEEIINMVPDLCDSLVKTRITRGALLTIHETARTKTSLILKVSKNNTHREVGPGILTVTAIVRVLDRSDTGEYLLDRAYIELNTSFTSYSANNYSVKHASVEAATFNFPFNFDAAIRYKNGNTLSDISPKERMINISRELGVSSDNALFMNSPTLVMWRMRPDSTIIERGRNYMNGSLTKQAKAKIKHVTDPAERSMLCLQHGVANVSE